MGQQTQGMSTTSLKRRYKRVRLKTQATLIWIWGAVTGVFSLLALISSLDTRVTIESVVSRMKALFVGNPQSFFWFGLVAWWMSYVLMKVIWGWLGAATQTRLRKGALAVWSVAVAGAGVFVYCKMYIVAEPLVSLVMILFGFIAWLVFGAGIGLLYNDGRTSFGFNLYFCLQGESKVWQTVLVGLLMILLVVAAGSFLFWGYNA